MTINFEHISVAVVGSVNLDLVASIKQFPVPGETVTNAVINRYPGGKGGNQADAGEVSEEWPPTHTLQGATGRHDTTKDLEPGTYIKGPLPARLETGPREHQTYLDEACKGR